MTYNGDKQGLPRSWAKLKNLEVIDIQCYGTSIIIDKVMLKIDSLRHLYSDICRSEVPLRKMRSLRKLYVFRVLDSNLWQLQGMEISSLAVQMSGMSDAGPLSTYLATMENLDRLVLYNNGDPINIAGLSALHHVTTQLTLDRFNDVMWFSGQFPPNLSHLTLSRLAWLHQDPMPILEKLSKLVYLKLISEKRGLEEMVISRHGFPSLKALHLQKLTKLVTMKIEEGGMPELNQFIIHQCPNLNIENLPEHLKSAMTDAHQTVNGKQPSLRL